MEALGQFGIKPGLLVAEIINFLIVAGILYYFVYPKISKFLDERKNKIAQGIENAEQAEKKQKEAETEKGSILALASVEASQEIKTAVETAKIRESQIIDQANQRAADIQNKALLKAEEDKQNIINSSREEIARMIVLGAEQTLKAKNT